MTLLNLTEVTATKTDESAFNNVQDAITGDLYPRTSGVATDKAGDLGSETYPWLSVSVVSGYVPHGMMIPWYDYNGLIPIPQGFMLCNGSVVNEANYDAQHSAGDWDLYISSSPIENLYLPNMNNKFIKGASASADGSIAIPSNGNIGNTIDLSHNHGSPVTTSAFNTVVNISDGADHTYTDTTGGGHTHSLTISTSLSASQDITPLAIAVKYLIRILE